MDFCEGVVWLGSYWWWAVGSLLGCIANSGIFICVGDGRVLHYCDGEGLDKVKTDIDLGARKAPWTQRDWRHAVVVEIKYFRNLCSLVTRAGL